MTNVYFTTQVILIGKSKNRPESPQLFVPSGVSSPLPGTVRSLRVSV